MITSITVDTNAPAVVHRQMLVHAPLTTVWQRHSDVESWPKWHPQIDTVQAGGQLAVGHSFAWYVHDRQVSFTVLRVDPLRATHMAGVSRGITMEQVWTFAERSDGVDVDAHGSWSGKPVLDDVEGMRGALDAALMEWLKHLKIACETT